MIIDVETAVPYITIYSSIQINETSNLSKLETIIFICHDLFDNFLDRVFFY